MGLHSFCCLVRQGTDGEGCSPGYPSRGESGGGNNKKTATSSGTRTLAVPGAGRCGARRGANRQSPPSRAHAAAAGLGAGCRSPPPPPAASALIGTEWSCCPINAASGAGEGRTYWLLNGLAISWTKRALLCLTGLATDRMWGRYWGMHACKCAKLGATDVL